MLDDVDRALLHALHVDGRAPFARIADVIGVSTQTVTRRYQRLRRDADLRVVGLPSFDRPGATRWLVRLTAAPSTAGELAAALARRPDTSWVRLASGGTEIVAVVGAESSPDGPPLLLHDLPRTTSVATVSAHALLHTYLGGPTSWPGRAHGLTTEQEGRLRSGSPAGAPAGPAPVPLDDGERRMLAVLGRDGRADLGALAAATGWSAATAARRLSGLRARGAVFFDVDLDDTHLGVGTRALLWLSVAPSDLDATARALAGHHELAFVAATTGTHGLVAQALASDPAGLHAYLTGPLAALGTIRAVETTPVLRTLKGAS